MSANNLGANSLRKLQKGKIFVEIYIFREDRCKINSEKTEALIDVLLYDNKADSVAELVQLCFIKFLKFTQNLNQSETGVHGITSVS